MPEDSRTMSMIPAAIILLFPFAAAAFGGGPYTSNHYYYNPMGADFILNPFAYMGPSCVTCDLPQPKPPLAEQPVIPVYDSSGRPEGAIVHGIYDPNAEPTPPHPYGQKERPFGISAPDGPRHPDWHIINHD